MKPWCEWMARPAITIPSMSWCGSISISGRSLQVPGSDSSALQITYFGFGESFGTNDHFMPVGNPAPPADERRFERVPFVQRAGNHRLRRGVFARVQILDDAIELERRKVFVEVVVYPHRRRTRARSDAFPLFQRENSVARRFLVPDLQPLLRA